MNPPLNVGQNFSEVVYNITAHFQCKQKNCCRGTWTINEISWKKNCSVKSWWQLHKFTSLQKRVFNASIFSGKTDEVLSYMTAYSFQFQPRRICPWAFSENTFLRFPPKSSKNVTLRFLHGSYVFSKHVLEVVQDDRWCHVIGGLSAVTFPTRLSGCFCGNFLEFFNLIRSSWTAVLLSQPGDIMITRFCWFVRSWRTLWFLVKYTSPFLYEIWQRCSVSVPNVVVDIMWGSRSKFNVKTVVLKSSNCSSSAAV